MAAFAVITVCAILLPELAREEAVGKANPPSATPFLIGAWFLSTPIFIALHQTLKLLNYIDKNMAFSQASVNALQNIKFCALIFSLLIVAGAISVVVLARVNDPTEDITPVFTIGFIITFASGVIVTFVAVLQRLLHDAITIKSENDLIV